MILLVRSMLTWFVMTIDTALNSLNFYFTFALFFLSTQGNGRASRNIAFGKKPELGRLYLYTNLPSS
jgi:hypothetical protein